MAAANASLGDLRTWTHHVRYFHLLYCYVQMGGCRIASTCRWADVLLCYVQVGGCRIASTCRWEDVLLCYVQVGGCIAATCRWARCRNAFTYRWAYVVLLLPKWKRNALMHWLQRICKDLVRHSEVSWIVSMAAKSLWRNFGVKKIII